MLAAGSPAGKKAATIIPRVSSNAALDGMHALLPDWHGTKHPMNAACDGHARPPAMARIAACC
jgi:hypothetical protein